MDFLVKRNWIITKEIIAGLKKSWRTFRSLRTRRERVRMFPLLYSNVVFLLGFLASWYVSILFIGVGIFMGIFLGITNRPHYFFLLLLPFVGLITLKLTQLYWTRFYPRYRKEYIQKLEFTSQEKSGERDGQEL